MWWCSCFLRRRKRDDESTADNSPSTGHSPGLRRSYGASAVTARQREEQQHERMHHPFRAFLRSVGILPSKTVDLGHHIAAVKIQRAWRRVLSQRLLDDEGYDTGGDHSNHDWRGRSSGSVSTRAQSAGPHTMARAASGGVPPRRIGGEFPMSAVRKRKESQVGRTHRSACRDWNLGIFGCDGTVYVHRK